MRSEKREIDPISRMVEHAAGYLPSQGPIGIFIHHNPLHHLEHLPFEEAVEKAAKLYNREPYLSEKQLERALRRGRIGHDQLRETIAKEVANLGKINQNNVEIVHCVFSALLLHRIPPGQGSEFTWLLEETEVLRTLRADIEQQQLEHLLTRARTRYGTDISRETIAGFICKELWQVCQGLVEQDNLYSPTFTKEKCLPIDPLRKRYGDLLDQIVSPLMIRLAAVYLDQGIAYWPMPDRDKGFYRCFVDLYRSRLQNFLDPRLASLPDLLDEESKSRYSSEASIVNSFKRLGIVPNEYENAILAALLTLPGWAGMFHQVELRPDRVPVHAVPARLVDFLAVRLLIDRAAIEKPGNFSTDLKGSSSTEGSDQVNRTEQRKNLAWKLFNVAQLLGWDGFYLKNLPFETIAVVLSILDRFSSVQRRRMLHLALEKRYRSNVLDALCSPLRKAEPIDRIKFQMIFCLDEREESIRRHVEECAAQCETFGTAGFFGIAIYYQGISDAHPHPLCPIAIKPLHEIREFDLASSSEDKNGRTDPKRFLGQAINLLSIGSKTFFRGSIISAGLGFLTLFPLISRVLFPRFAALIKIQGRKLIDRPRPGKLKIDSDESIAPIIAERYGFSKMEMAGIVERLLTDTGIVSHLSPTVLLVGHGSTSLNNPHESAHDCGACGGGRGGPNARAFALMANDRIVREILHSKGLEIPDSTHFIGAEHDTCADTMVYYGIEALSPEQSASFTEIKRVVDLALKLNAKERCRRFFGDGKSINLIKAERHAWVRSEDLAQPRPEYGHATNAFCVIGRRIRTKQLFCDRRAFLVSYDPETDDEQGTILAGIITAVIPVVLGINLEYYFGFVDPSGYGCGTKLPHNITSLLGVMDGYQSDLRTGLPWQMVEIHEPVRLLVVIETKPEILDHVLNHNEHFRRLIVNRWAFLATLDPTGSGIHLFKNENFVEYHSGDNVLCSVRRSGDWFEARSEHLPFARTGDTEG